jgi:hypothetical protein
LTSVGFILFCRVMSELLEKIEAFLKAKGMSATAFGKAALGDPRFVSDLRKGTRSVTMRTNDTVLAFIAEHEANAGRADAA